MSTKVPVCANIATICPTITTTHSSTAMETESGIFGRDGAPGSDAGSYGADMGPA